MRAVGVAAVGVAAGLLLCLALVESASLGREKRRARALSRSSSSWTRRSGGRTRKVRVRVSVYDKAEALAALGRSRSVLSQLVECGRELENASAALSENGYDEQAEDVRNRGERWERRMKMLGGSFSGYWFYGTGLAIWGKLNPVSLDAWTCGRDLIRAGECMKDLLLDDYERFIEAGKEIRRNSVTFRKGCRKWGGSKVDEQPDDSNSTNIDDGSRPPRTPLTDEQKLAKYVPLTKRKLKVAARLLNVCAQHMGKAAELLHDPPTPRCIRHHGKRLFLVGSKFVKVISYRFSSWKSKITQSRSSSAGGSSSYGRYKRSLALASSHPTTPWKDMSLEEKIQRFRNRSEHWAQVSEDLSSEHPDWFMEPISGSHVAENLVEVRRGLRRCGSQLVHASRMLEHRHIAGYYGIRRRGMRTWRFSFWWRFLIKRWHKLRGGNAQPDCEGVDITGAVSGGIEDTPFNQTVSLSCLQGFTLVDANGTLVPSGVSNATCSEGGAWSSEILEYQCEPHCDPINNISNAVPIEDRAYGETAELQCEDGFTLVLADVSSDDPVQLTCGDGGIWDQEIDGYQCVPDCQETGLDNGSTVGVTKVQDSAEVSCNQGYVLTDDTGAVIPTGTLNLTCNIDGSWDTDLTSFSCQPPCTGSAVTIDNAVVIQDTSFEQTAQLECSQGFDLMKNGAPSASVTLSCGAEGEWSPDTGSYECVAAGCPPLEVANGVVAGTDSEVTLSCAPLYRLKLVSSGEEVEGGEVLLSCSEGQWLPAASDYSCEAKSGVVGQPLLSSDALKANITNQQWLDNFEDMVEGFFGNPAEVLVSTFLLVDYYQFQLFFPVQSASGAVRVQRQIVGASDLADDHRVLPRRDEWIPRSAASRRRQLGLLPNHRHPTRCLHR